MGGSWSESSSTEVLLVEQGECRERLWFFGFPHGVPTLIRTAKDGLIPGSFRPDTAVITLIRHAAIRTRKTIKVCIPRSLIMTASSPRLEFVHDNKSEGKDKCLSQKEKISKIPQFITKIKLKMLNYNEEILLTKKEDRK